MNASPHVIDVTAENFQTDVADKMRDTPVLLEFHPGGPPQGESATLLRLADEYAGKFLLARLDVQQNQQLTQQLAGQLGVRSLPALRLLYEGQVQDLDGAGSEQALRSVLDQVTMSPVERFREQVDAMLATGDRTGAIQLLQAAIAEEPKNYGLHTELCDLLIMEGQADEARQILAALPSDAEGLSKPQHRMEFMNLAADLADLAELEVAAAGNESKALYEFAVGLVANDRMAQALEVLLELLKRDREWEDETARKTMIKVFDLLGKGNPLATDYRRKMFTFMH